MLALRAMDFAFKQRSKSMKVKLCHCQSYCIMRAHYLVLLCLSHDLICSIFRFRFRFLYKFDLIFSFSFFSFIFFNYMDSCLSTERSRAKKITKHQTLNFKQPYKLTRHAFAIGVGQRIIEQNTNNKRTKKQKLCVFLFVPSFRILISFGMDWNGLALGLPETLLCFKLFIY